MPPLLEVAVWAVLGSLTGWLLLWLVTGRRPRRPLGGAIIAFPGMAATWNPELALRAAQVTAAETRATGIPWNFSPVLDIGRQPLWPQLSSQLP